MKTIGITGGTGFIGRHLTAHLIRQGYQVVVFTTRVAKKRAKQHITYSHWDPVRGTCDIIPLEQIDAMVNLAGVGIADKRWRKKQKEAIVDSRVNSTQFLTDTINTYAPSCKTLVTASATGFYGPDSHYSSSFTEEAPAYNDFLGNTCRRWEHASEHIDPAKRRVVLRFGIVLSKDGGAFQQLANPVSYGVLPILGSGGQVVSWIEMHDLVRLILYAIEHPQVEGIYNAVAPGHVSHRQMMRVIGEEKGGFKIPFHVPSALLKVLLGEVSVEVLKSCTASADKILATGFTFDHPDIENAIRTIMKKPAPNR